MKDTLYAYIDKGMDLMLDICTSIYTWWQEFYEWD